MLNFDLRGFAVEIIHTNTVNADQTALKRLPKPINQNIYRNDPKFSDRPVFTKVDKT